MTNQYGFPLHLVYRTANNPWAEKLLYQRRRLNGTQLIPKGTEGARRMIELLKQGEHIGIIAQNGNGKTTLLNIIAGKEDYDSGRITFHNDIKVGYLMQNPSFSPELTILQACFDSPNETVQAISRYEKALYENEPQALHDAIEEMDRLKAWEYEHRVKGILSKLNIKNF